MTFATLGASIRRAVSTWRWYLFTLLFTISATAFEKVGVYTEFNLWLKSTGTYTTTQINYYPSIFTAVRQISFQSTGDHRADRDRPLSCRRTSSP
jgi:ACS family pantothenate transporter-like MFS transporter